MSAFCFSPEIIDIHLFQLWLKGLTVSQATSAREDADPILRDVLEMDTADHFRLFEELQPSLEEPRSTMCLLDIAPSVRLTLAELFYSFDDIVVREFLGRKFTTRARRELDDVSEITGVPRRACLRQFDNLKRIYDAGDELGFQVQYPAQKSVADTLRDEFLISRPLMARYEAILFLMHQRFNLASSTKKKQPLYSLRELEFCAVTILNAWCVKAPFQPIAISSRNQSLEGFESPPPFNSTTAASQGGSGLNLVSTPMASTQHQTPGDLFCPFELDAALFAKFRDFRARGNQYQGDVWASLAPQLEDPHEKKRVENRFKAWFRSLLQCATGRDLKDFFEDLNLGVVEPLTEMRCDAEKLFEALDRAVVQTFSYNDVQIWHSLMGGIRPCTLRLYSSHPQRMLAPIEANDGEEE